MWLKSMQVLKYTAPTGKTPEDYVTGLAKQPLQSCPTTVAQAYGWSHPLGLEDEVVLTVGDFHISHFVVAKRILPPNVIKQTLQDKVAMLEKQQGYAMGKREQRKMQDEIHFELLPKAFVEKKSYIVLWQHSTQKLFVATNQASVIDLIGQSMAYCNPGWQLKHIEPNKAVDRQLTAWLMQKLPLPAKLSWGDACELQDRSNKFCKIRFSGADVNSEDVRRHLQESMTLNHAAVVWDNTCRFVWHANTGLSQIKYLDIEKDHDSSMSEQERLIADISLLAPLYARMHEDLMDALEGVKQAPAAKPMPELVESF